MITVMMPMMVNLQARAASKAVSLSLMLGNRYTSSDWQKGTCGHDDDHDDHDEEDDDGDWQNGTSLESITLCLQTLSSSLTKKDVRNDDDYFSGDASYLTGDYCDHDVEVDDNVDDDEPCKD